MAVVLKLDFKRKERQNKAILPTYNPMTDPLTAQQKFIRETQESAGRRLYLPQDMAYAEALKIPETSLQPLQGTVKWLQDFIMMPHPNLGRSGPVCPYVKPSIDAQLLYLSVAQPEKEDDLASVDAEMTRYAQIFQNIPIAKPDEKFMRVIMVLFPQTPEQIFGNQAYLKEIKTRMMHQDIMIGQFYPSTDVKAILKAKFFPIQPPTSMFVMRSLIEFDREFLKDDPEWMAIYREKFPHLFQ